MQLLYGSSVPVPQFACLSLLLAEGAAVPITCVAPIATCSAEDATAAVHELLCHVRSIVQCKDKADSASELLRDEIHLLNTTQIFRSRAANGVGLHYRFLRWNGSDEAKVQSLVLAVHKSTPGKVDPTCRVLGVVFCVAVTGWGMLHSPASMPYALSQRMNDCVGHLLRLKDLESVKSLLTVFLLTQDECRLTDKMAEAPNLLLLSEPDERSRGGGVLSPLGMISPIAEFNRKARRASTGIVRGVMSAGTGIGAMNHAANTQEATPAIDLSSAIRLDGSSFETARAMTEKLTILSVAENGTILRKYTNSGRDRTANLDLTSASKSRFRRRKVDTRAADFDNFDYKGVSNVAIKRENKSVATTLPMTLPTQGKLQLKSSSKDTKRGGPGTRRMSTAMSYRDDDVSHPLKLNGAHPTSQRRVAAQFDDETHDSRSHSGNHDTQSVMSQERVQVNIALNEDLTCSYKQSQLSSSIVEGVIQAQVRSTTGSWKNPFILLLVDSSAHLDNLHENKKFVEKMSSHTGESAHKFKITIPKQETFFPLFKYKCTQDLRPVPIRVQTKVKVDVGFCRVALQISSNPNNEGNLSDLSIVMGAPNTIRGETLVTQPAGGVWDKAKSTVVWCVSELGSGEKFQLQARFELDEETRPVNDLNFPVLIRCQCLHMQLSDVELEVSDSVSDSRVEMAMKVARRYRLSHREKNG